VQNKKWLAKVFKSMTVDEAGRMREIADVLALLPGNKLSVLSRAAVLAAEAAAKATASGSGEGTGLRKTGPDTDSDEDEDDDKERALWEDPRQPLEKRKLAALEELDDLVSSADNAKNLFAVGAFPSLMQVVLGAAPPEWKPAGEAVTAAAAGAGEESASSAFATLAVQARAAEVLTTVLQNNPAAQMWSLQSGCLHGLVTALTHAINMADYWLLVGRKDASEASPAVASPLNSYLHLQTALISALSSLTRHNGQAQAALVAGINLSTGASSSAADASTSVVMTMPAFEVDIPSSLTATTTTAGETSDGRSIPLHEAAKALRRHQAVGPVEESSSKALVLRVSPFQLITHPISFWPLFCGIPSGSGSTKLPEDSASKGRRLVRKSLFFLQHLAQGGINPDEIKAAVLNTPSDAFAWLSTSDGSSSASSAVTAEGGKERGILPWLLQVLGPCPSASEADIPSTTLGTDGDSVHCRESALSILLALSQKSEKGVDVKDETERRKPVSGFKNPASSSPSESSSSATGTSGSNPYVASVPTAAAVMIEDRRRRQREQQQQHQQQQQEQSSQAQGHQQQGQEEGQSEAPEIAGLLTPPPPNYDASHTGGRAPSNLPPHRFVTTVAVTPAGASGGASSDSTALAPPAATQPPAEPSVVVPSTSATLPAPSLTLPQRLAVLLKTTKLIHSLESHKAQCKAQAEGLLKKARERDAGGKKKKKEGDEDEDDGESEVLRDQAEILSNEAELAQGVVNRLKTAASVMRAVSSGGGV
jgi:hypothetical protein